MLTKMYIGPKRTPAEIKRPCTAFSAKGMRVRGGPEVGQYDEIKIWSSQIISQAILTRHPGCVGERSGSALCDGSGEVKGHCVLKHFINKFINFQDWTIESI